MLESQSNPVKRVLIFYLSIGSGHLSAARAIQAALERRNPGVQVFVEDLFGGVHRPPGMTDLLTAVSTMLIPGLYDWAWQTGAMRGFFQLITWMPMLRKRVLDLLQQIEPEIVVCTHALPCAILSEFGKKGNIPPLLAVATDFDVHPYWPVQRVDGFVVASLQARARLEKRGYPTEKIFNFGIPVQPVISDLAQSKNQNVDQPLRVLMLAGGGSLGPYLPIAKKSRAILKILSERPLPDTCWKIIFGKNSALLRSAKEIIGNRSDVQLLGFVDDMPAYMAEADLIVTKPGGLALAESLALGKPVLLLQRGAGQENANTAAVLAEGAGILLDTPEALFRLIEEFKQQPEQLQELQRNARALGMPQASIRTAELVETLAAKRGF